jgi:hypothetical protein
VKSAAAAAAASVVVVVAVVGPTAQALGEIPFAF